MQFRLRQSVKWFILITSLVLFIVIGRVIYLEEQGNFHTITQGEAYRSAQMDRDELEYYIPKFGIKSVINLRGRHPKKEWWKIEEDVCQRLGVRHFDIAMSASKAPSPAKIRLLLTIFQTAPRPVLVHCKAGSDRSGLAAAIWKVVIDKEPKSEAKKQLSIVYGHLPFGSTQALDDFFDKWNGISSRE
ncbi:MAG: protein tyrosine phosphatase [Nitrospiraceae bacterium]|nr:protein tyrosine phosphatase [Nitrospiraceae bacterium]